MPQFQLAGADTPDYLALDTFTRAYIEALFFTEGESLDDERMSQNPQDAARLVVGFADLAPETLATIAADCARFWAENAADLATAGEAGYSMYQCGHDFWLTRNGHGAGFWDRPALACYSVVGDVRTLGDRLSDACKSFGEVSACLGDGGKVYLT